MNREIIDLLYRENPWLEHPETLHNWFISKLPQEPVQRHIVKNLASRWNETNRAHLLIGPRQAGKTTALWMHLTAKGKPVLHLNCELRLLREWCREAPLFLGDLDDIIREPVPFLFDEVQHLEEAGLFIKGIVDRKPGVPVFVTGSSSFHLGAKTRESLAGRATRSRLYPFSLDEVLQDANDLPEARRTMLCAERFDRHVVFGGYPEAWLAERPEHRLMDLVESIILRDASDLHKVARVDAFDRLLHLMAGQVGNLVNVSEWSSLLSLNHATVASYIEILDESHIIKLVRPFAAGKRAEVKSRPKVFFVDNGIRNQLLHAFEPMAGRVDAGPLFENWVFSELLKQLPLDATLHYWRSAAKAEVDFVVELGQKLVGIEVKAQAMHKPALSRSSRSFIEAYEPEQFFVVNLGLEHEEELDRTLVRWVKPLAVGKIPTQFVTG